MVGSSWATYALFHNPMCGLIFACGCTFTFRGGWKQCNVHFLGLRSPRCPWCVSPRDTPQWTWTTGEACTIIVMISSWVFATFAISRRIHHHEPGRATYSTLVNSSEKNQPQDSALLCRVQTRSSKHAVCIRRVAPFLAFLLHHSIVGLAFAIGTGYPYYFFLQLPNTQLPSLPLPPFINASASAVATP